MSLYLPDGCTQADIDRAAGGYDPEPPEQEEIEMLEEEYGYDDDSTKAGCGHWDSEEHLSYLPDGSTLCCFCQHGATLIAPPALRKPPASVATGEGEDWLEMERRLRA